MEIQGISHNFKCSIFDIWPYLKVDFLNTVTTSHNRTFGYLFNKTKTKLNVAGRSSIGGTFPNFKIFITKIGLNHHLDSFNTFRWKLHPMKQITILGISSPQMIRGICFSVIIITSWISLHNPVQNLEIDQILENRMLSQANSTPKLALDLLP